MANANLAKPRGILNPGMGETKFQLSRHAPATDLGFFVECYWLVQWDLRGQEPYLQENIPHPCVHLVFDAGKTAIFGVVKKRFSYLLRDKGHVLGIKFRPGGFYTFAQIPVSNFTDRVCPIGEIFDVNAGALEAEILGQADEGKRVALAETFLRAHLPERDETIVQINRIVDCIIDDRTLTKVENLVDRFNLSKRALQRLFSQYIGVGPKWVIQRYRLHEAAEQLAAGAEFDWPQMAIELGYTDQAHFIKDFKSMVGKTPADYARNIG